MRIKDGWVKVPDHRILSRVLDDLFGERKPTSVVATPSVKRCADPGAFEQGLEDTRDDGLPTAMVGWQQCQRPFLTPGSASACERTSGA